MDILQQLHMAISAVCPIDGASIGKIDDKTTWRLDFAAGATTQQRAAAQNIINQYDLAAAAAAESTEAARVTSFGTDAGQIDLLQRLKTATPAQIDTWLVNNVTTLAQARTVLGAVIKFLAARKLF